MNTDLIEYKLKTAVEHLTPDIKDQILADCKKEAADPAVIPLPQQHDPRSRNTGWIKALSLGAAACIMIGGVFWWNRFRALNYIVEMDVNPSIELRINNAERVISAEALNEDAALILDDMPLAGVDIDVATNAIIGSMVKNGYLSELSNSILLSVSSDDAQKSAEVTARLTGEINAALGSFQGSVIAQQLTTDEEIQSIAATYDISEGKASLVRSIHAALPMLAEKDLAAMSINDLNLLAESKQVTPQNIETTGAASDQAYIGTDRASTIALEHAGVAADAAQGLHAELDYDDGVMEYEVEFYAGGVEYEYSIAARSGTILSYEMDLPSSSDIASGSYLSESAVREAALADAGVEAADATFIKTALGREDGQMVYEVEFFTSDGEYSYELDAVTGAVRKKENTIQDFSTGTDSNYITAEQAQTAALSHAGYSESDAVLLKTERDHDDGTILYEVEFIAGGREYEYDIDAVTGAVLKFDFETAEDLSLPSAPSGTADSGISMETAQQAVLARLELTTEDAIFQKSERDEDDGRIVYEFELTAGGIKYEAKVDASTGSVLELEQDD